MLRFFTTWGFYGLYKCSHPVASCGTKCPAFSFLPVSSVSHHRVSVPTRRFSAGTPVYKDALQSNSDKTDEVEKIDLEKWKSVMRSNVADDDEYLGESGGDGSSLETTRELVAMWRQAGRLVPQEMTDEQVKILAELTTKSSKKKYLKYLAIKEGHKRARKEKQQQRKAEREAAMEEKRGQVSDAEDGDGQTQKQVKNSFLLQFWSRSLDKLLAWRSAQSMVFGQPLVFDMSYDSHMSRHEIENTVSQLMEVEAWNRRAVEPYHLHFCNLQPDGAYKKELVKRYGAETWDRLLITSTDRQHVNLFPREQLVYLTADSPNILRNFDHSKVYIIGALVDRSIKSGLSLANAKRLKLATARLPLNEFLHWEVGAKNLTLDQMMRIMITIKETGKWEEALKFVPRRKHDGFYQQETQKNITKNGVRGTNVKEWW
uniref:tRNA methyltransferase 10 homolog C n=1 Tax=Mastacembelus armatus TaxID=205130 RepID=A0A3Q3L4Z9_9TELE